MTEMWGCPRWDTPAHLRRYSFFGPRERAERKAPGDGAGKSYCAARCPVQFSGRPFENPACCGGGEIHGLQAVFFQVPQGGRQKKRPLMRPFLHMGPMLRAGVGISVHGATRRAMWTIVSPGIPLALSLPALPAEKIEVRKFLLTSAPGINVSRVGVQTYCRCGKTVFRS